MDIDMDTTFSVVTVVLNDLSGLLKTRASLVEQSTCDWRHIIVDGASTDGSELFGAQVNSDPKTVFQSEKDDGIYYAMEKGWKSAVAGTFVVFLNAGDVFTSPDSLRIAKNRIESSPKSLNWACSTHEEIMPDGSNWVCKLVSEPTLANQLYAFGYRSHQGVLMKKEFIDSLGGFDRSLKIASDWDLIVRAMQSDAPEVWREPLIRFEIGGFSSQRLLQAHLELRILRERYLWKRRGDRFFDDIYCAIFLSAIGYENYLTKVGRTLKRLKFWPNFGSLLSSLSIKFFGVSESRDIKSSWWRMKLRRMINLGVGLINWPKYLRPFFIGKLRSRLAIKPLAKP
jgi:glycosyltransferase involved in cell wall biosynthesis